VNLAQLLVRTAQAWPRLPAVARGTAVVHDYESLARRASAVAAAMRRGGLAAGDRVLVLAHNCASYVETLFACWMAALVAVPANAKLHPREAAFIAGDSGSRWAFVDESWHGGVPTHERVVVLDSRDYGAMAGGAPPLEVAALPDDTPAWLFYTSGTTGRPKGVQITHGNLRAMTQCFLSDVEAIAPGDAILHAAPMSHGSGLYVVPHVARGAVSVVPESGGFDAGELAALVPAWRNALFFAAPTMVKRFVESREVAGANLANLKCIVYGGGPMYAADCKAAYAVLGPKLAQIYGQGESPMTITAMDRAMVADAIARGDDARIGSVGQAQTGIEVRVAGDDDEPLAAGAAGEVLVRGPSVMRGYWRNPEASARTLRSGWLHTGDVGAMSEDGFLTLLDRSKDLIISGGSNIYPREVEEVLLRHPGVAEAAVVGRPHADWGEEVVAFVVSREPPGEALSAALDALCLSQIARFKRPKAYRFVDTLPKNDTGKVLKTELRRELETEPVIRADRRDNPQG
jgi:long-chain acyl-CoA synthetase